MTSAISYNYYYQGRQSVRKSRKHDTIFLSYSKQYVYA